MESTAGQWSSRHMIVNPDELTGDVRSADIQVSPMGGKALHVTNQGTMHTTLGGESVNYENVLAGNGISESIISVTELDDQGFATSTDIPPFRCGDTPV